MYKLHLLSHKAHELLQFCAADHYPIVRVFNIVLFFTHILDMYRNHNHIHIVQTNNYPKSTKTIFTSNLHIVNRTKLNIVLMQ